MKVVQKRERVTMSKQGEDLTDGEPGYIDFSDPAIVKRELKEAFKKYKPPAGGRQGRAGLDGKPPKRRGIAPWKWEENLSTSKFCFERASKMLAYLGMGMFVTQVCALVGVKSDTFVRWLDRGKDPAQGPYYVFARAVEQIAAGFEAQHVGNIHRMTFGRDPVTHRRFMLPKESADMSLRMLKAKFPKRWGDRMDVTSDGKPLSETRPSRIEFAFVDKSTATPATSAAAVVGAREDDSSDEG